MNPNYILFRVFEMVYLLSDIEGLIASGLNVLTSHRVKKDT